MDAQDTIKNWMDEEAAMRRKAAPAGVANFEQLRGSTGLEILQKVGSGKLPPPPIAELIGFVPIEVEHGRIVFQGTPGRQHYNPSGAVIDSIYSLEDAKSAWTHFAARQLFGKVVIRHSELAGRGRWAAPACESGAMPIPGLRSSHFPAQ